ncbi:hypothetical protein [Levyella massiliensis]|uniref:hypothetical protein n=1 Tax=Levyella massiliensis TaxID=938289 RepID=UPI000369C139|nr:hypothetical protein [Levyella massiliensis]
MNEFFGFYPMLFSKSVFIMGLDAYIFLQFPHVILKFRVLTWGEATKFSPWYLQNRLLTWGFSTILKDFNPMSFAESPFNMGLFDDFERL